ncbi:FeoC-like transcriptional regulator, partial [Psychromonas hadalis]
MILQAITDYVKSQGRIEESVLLQHFRLTEEGLSPMMSILLQCGKLHKSVHQRGDKLPL